MSNGNGKGPGSNHKRVKLKSRPLNVERDEKYKSLISKKNKLKGKKKGIINSLRLKLLDKKIKRGRKGSRLDQTWG